MVQHLFRFLQVGGVAFAVDAGLLWLLVYGAGVPPIPARVCSFIVTIAVSFVLNARYTFAASIKESSKSRYILIQCAGSAINFGVYSGLVMAGMLGPLWALVVGSFLGSAHNFLMMRRFVFASPTGRPRP